MCGTNCDRHRQLRRVAASSELRLRRCPIAVRAQIRRRLHATHDFHFNQFIVHNAACRTGSNIEQRTSAQTVTEQGCQYEVQTKHYTVSPRIRILSPSKFMFSNGLLNRSAAYELLVPSTHSLDGKQGWSHPWCPRIFWLAAHRRGRLFRAAAARQPPEPAAAAAAALTTCAADGALHGLQLPHRRRQVSRRRDGRCRGRHAAHAGCLKP